MGRKTFAFIVAVLFFYVASPLIFPVAMGGVLAVLFLPWLEILERRKISTSAGSALLTLGITLFFVLPAALVTFVSAKAGLEQLQEIKANPTPGPAADGDWIRALLETPKIQALMDWATHFLPIRANEMVDATLDLFHSLGAKLADLLGQLATHLPGMVMALAVIAVSVYFFLVDGRRLVLFLRRNSMFSAQQTDQLIHALAGTCRSVILASVVSGAAQAAFELLVCLTTGVSNATLIGILVFMASFIPVVGAVPITFGVAIYEFFLDRNGAAIVLLVAAVIVILLDNFIRPVFLRGTANLHPLLAFVAAFGGLQTLGFSGIFLGPIIAAMFVATVKILTHGEVEAHKVAEKPLL